MESQQVPSQRTPKSDSAAPHSSVLGDAIISQTAAEDPLFKFLQQWWRQLALLVAAVLVTYFAKNAFDQTYRSNMKRAGEMYSNLHKEYSELDALAADVLRLGKEKIQKEQDAKASASDKENAAKSLTEAEGKLKQSSERVEDLAKALSDARQPYKQIGQLYQALIAARRGDLAPTKLALGLSAWQALKPDSKQRFMAELATLSLTTTALDDASLVADARSALSKLALEGTYMNVAAAIKFSRSASTPDELIEARKVLEDLKVKQSEQSSILDGELKRVGG